MAWAESQEYCVPTKRKHGESAIHIYVFLGKCAAPRLLIQLITTQVIHKGPGVPTGNFEESHKQRVSDTGFSTFEVGLVKTANLK